MVLMCLLQNTGFLSSERIKSDKLLRQHHHWFLKNL